jgi:hypothetical protein
MCWDFDLHALLLLPTSRKSIVFYVGWCFLCVFCVLCPILLLLSLCFTNDQMLGAIRCLDRALLYPPENPVMCHYAKPLNDTFVVGCCKDYDLCNRDLKPVLHVRNVTGKETPVKACFLLLPFCFLGHIFLIRFFLNNKILFVPSYSSPKVNF